MTVSRRLASLLVVDAVDYVGMMEKEEDNTYHHVSTTIANFIEPSVRQYRELSPKILVTG